ncbi:MAG TPA: hypothetical protein VD815_06545 [Candidatus Saccharimonadales bacterium]|nr:hypothetical protein [Candidatus Saccharimonadales bacterium]
MLVEDGAYALVSKNSSSSFLLSGIISLLLFDISPYTENLTNDSKYTDPFKITNIPKFILAGDWKVKLSILVVIVQQTIILLAIWK